MSCAPGGESGPVAILERALHCGLQAAAPRHCLPPLLDTFDTRGAALVLGMGKAAAEMAATFTAHWAGAVRGMVVTRYGHGLESGETCTGVEIAEAAHPSPDRASEAAGSALLALAGTARPDETAWCLVSGGGSSLAVAALPGLTLEHKRDVADFLLRNGADIRDINCVRRRLSAIKGGRLAARAHPARVITLAISDVPGDDPSAIASGPTLPGTGTAADALEVLERYRYPRVEQLREVLSNPVFEPPQADDPAFAADEVHVVARAATALQAATAFLQQAGYRVVCLGDDLHARARSLGSEHAAEARKALDSGVPTALISGGETSVVVCESGGRGGRNLEYLAGLALELNGLEGVYALAADTDGLDGNADHAGGLVVPDMLQRGAALGLSLPALLAASDSYRWFDACNLLLRTGPTRTNVNDFRLILCNPVE